MFPSRPWRLSPTDSLPRTDGRYSEFGWSREFPPFPIQCSTPGRLNREADPRAISGRASYHQARLAFHRYPQVIPWVFTPNGFGPPAGITPPSPCPRVDRLASGLWPVTGRPFRTRFRYGSAPEGLSLATDHNSPAHTAKGMRSPFGQGPEGPRPPGSHCLWADGFTFYFTPLPGFFSPFPHGTGALSVSREYLALEGGPP